MPNKEKAEDKEKEIKARSMMQINSNGNLDRVGTVTQEVTPKKLSRIFKESSFPGNMQRLFELYRKIEAYDGKIKGLIEKRRKAPTRFPTKYEVTDKSHPKSEEVKEFIEDAMSNLDMKRLIRKTMNGILHGVQLMENIWFKRRDGAVVPSDPIVISGSRYGQKNEVEHGLGDDPDWGKLYISTGVQRTDRLFLDEIDDNKIYKSIYAEERGFYDLAGVMRPLCKWYLFKYFAGQYWIEYDETYGFPTTVVNVPKADYAEFKDELEEFLQNVGRNKFGILLEGMEYEVHSQQQAGQVDVFEHLVNYSNKEIIYTITGQDLTESGSQGSYAESLVGYDMETDLVIDDAEFVDKCINENIIEPLIRYNFQDVPTDLVKHNIDTPERKDWSRITKKWELAAKLSLKGVSKKQIEEELEIEFAEDEEDSIDLAWRQTNSGGEHPPGSERGRDDGGSQAENNAEEQE